MQTEISDPLIMKVVSSAKSLIKRKAKAVIKIIINEIQLLKSSNETITIIDDFRINRIVVYS